MRKLSSMVVVIAAIIATLTGGVSAAAATPAHLNPAGDTSIQACGPSGPPNGRFTISDAAGFCTGYRSCSWTGNDQWYGDTPASGGGNCNDMATSAWNNGFPETYEDVILSKHINYGAPTILLCRGDYLLNMSLDHWTDGTNANNSASSHKWTVDWFRCG